MKKIFTLLVALVCVGFAANAQKSADIEIINSLRTQDTISYNTNGTVGKLVLTGFVNHGPSALSAATDTLIWRSVANAATYRLSLPSAGMAVNDTLYVAIDTVVVNAAPTNNPFTWCDSIYARSSGVAIPDPVLANNKLCKTVFFKKVPNTAVPNVVNGKSEISIYPNPANNNLNVEYVFGNNEEAVLFVRDLLGKTIIRKDLGKNLNGAQKYSFDVSALSNGLYIVELNTTNNKVTSKLTIRK